MIQNFQENLSQLTKNNKDQQQRLQTLYLRFDSLFNDYLDVIKSSQVSQNLLHKVRPEVFNQVFVFLDIKSYLSFRLISKRANQTVIQMIPLRISRIHQIILNLNHQLQIYTIQNFEQTNCQNIIKDYQNALDQLYQLNKEDLLELKRTRNPPKILVTVILMICVLLDQSFKIEQNWEECLKIIGNFNYVNSLHNLDFEKINESQLTYIQKIRQISEAQTQKISIACSTFYQFILAVLQIKESKQYILKRKIEFIEQSIKQGQKHLIFLQKMIEQIP
ncbi:unnamed protein product [Paramecium sonneborni]|uniref:F-box domain-containing protein n=1 Tax=Paramecium sonneborni TaxID=65129 RepID=A0A8S1QBP7_9CILI|nr:unnamed protein product [Paramecium sonneborni]